MIHTLKSMVLMKALAHIPQGGWTLSSLEEGARQAQVDPHLVPLLFPQGGLSAYAAFMDHINTTLMDIAPALELHTKGTTAKIETLIMAHLDLMTTHKEALQWGRTFYRTPKSVFLCSKLAWRVADTLWHLAGDTSLDHNHYTKRLLLSYIYAAVYHKWLNAPANYTTDQFLAYTQEKIRSTLKIPQYIKGLCPAKKNNA